MDVIESSLPRKWTRSKMHCLKIYLLLNRMMLIYLRIDMTRWQADGATLGEVRHIVMLTVKRAQTLHCRSSAITMQAAPHLCSSNDVGKRSLSVASSTFDRSGVYWKDFRSSPSLVLLAFR